VSELSVGTVTGRGSSLFSPVPIIGLVSAYCPADLLNLKAARYEFELDMLSTIRRGLPICSCQVKDVYMDGNISSHFDSLRDSIKIYCRILALPGHLFAP
jgi:hypothetical protein